MSSAAAIPNAAAAGPALRTFLSSPSPSHSENQSAYNTPPTEPPRTNPADDPTQTSPTTLTSLPTASPPSLATLRHDLNSKGFCIIPQFLTPAEIHNLRAAAAALTERARNGEWNHVRTLPRQFPPWPVHEATEKGIWGVQHLLHPALPAAERAAFANLYFEPRILELCLGLMRGDRSTGKFPKAEQEEESLVMELLNLLVTPPADFGLRWHRDSVPFDGVSVGEETARLGLNEAATEGGGKSGGDGGKRRDAHHVQYNIPLYRDQSLILIPSSHLRPRTATELEILKDPYAPELPNMLVVDAQPGDVVFYDNNVIHTGRYSSQTPRLTLHGCVGDVRGGTGRARNILQHGIGGWVGACGFEGVLSGERRRRAEGMKDNLMELGRSAGVEDARGIYDE